MSATDPTASTEATHTNDSSSARSYGYVGFCHIGKARTWSMSLKECETQCQDFIQARPKYMTRKGLFIYKLADGKEFIKRVNRDT